MFGQVLIGMDVVKEMEVVKTDSESKPLVPVQISNCGELVPELRSMKCRF